MKSEKKELQSEVEELKKKIAELEQALVLEKAIIDSPVQLTPQKSSSNNPCIDLSKNSACS